MRIQENGINVSCIVIDSSHFESFVCVWVSLSRMCVYIYTYCSRDFDDVKRVRNSNSKQRKTYLPCLLNHTTNTD